MTYAPLTFEYSRDFTTTDSGADAPEAVPEPPTISATNTTNGQIGRVIATWGSASATVALLSRRYQKQWDGAIQLLHDHKGTLEVTWRDQQSRELFEGVIMGAWERAGEHCGSHTLA